MCRKMCSRIELTPFGLLVYTALPVERTSGTNVISNLLDSPFISIMVAEAPKTWYTFLYSTASAVYHFGHTHYLIERLVVRGYKVSV